MTPSERWGPLFAAVQEGGVFADSKTFADAVPRGDPDTVMAAWHAAGTLDGDALRAFVHRHFELPSPALPAEPGVRPLAEHIGALWSDLTREAVDPPPAGSLLPLPHSYVVPGGRFRELYYWDSWFTMLGLRASGRQDLIDAMIADFGHLLERHGRIPNATRSYYLGRSHPPVFHLMAAMASDRSSAARRRRLDWLRTEHRFWMAGEERLAPGDEHARVVRLADGSLLNRYWDDSASPRDESWREDVALAAACPDRPAAELWRDLRAAAESGWDFSSRWLGDGRTLATIRTTRLLPIDLNALLHGLERAIAADADALGDASTGDAFRARADARAAAIARHLWSDAAGTFCDYDLDLARPSADATAAQGFALFAGLASPEQARGVAAGLRRLLRAGGLATTASISGEQWDAPNGWAPLQWIAVAGLDRYGEVALADTIATRWLTTVERAYDTHRQLFEKYDVESGGGGGGGEYALETGFGWTNGVTLALRDRAARRASGAVAARADAR